MKIQWYSNACVRISAKSGTNILCDPWVNEGAFLGSWFHWPPTPENFEEDLLSHKCDGVYISHLHPDHYDPKFISKFSKINPEVPIYIAEFAHPWLKRSLSSVLHNNSKLIEIPTSSEIDIGSGLKMKVFAADTCHPSICQVNIPRQTESSLRAIDSVAVFSADGLKVVNANDAMGVDLVPKIAANIGTADLLMGHYGGASPYPQCFPDVADKKAAAENVVRATCEMLIQAADTLNCKYIMPFAGQYVLGGRLVTLNENRATLPLDKAVNFLRTLTTREIISVRTFGVIDLTFNTFDPEYIEPDHLEIERYFKKISNTIFPYEDALEKALLKPDLLNAVLPIIECSKRKKLGVKNSFVIGDGKDQVTINLDPYHIETSAELGNKPKFDTVTQITMHPALLKRLSNRKHGYKGFTPMHWNQADVGSHFTWKRKGTYDLASHSLLNFFGT